MPPKSKHVYGVKKLKTNLTASEKIISKELVQSMVELAKDILTDANEHCPVDTGSLRNSAKAVIHRGRSRDIHEVAKVGGASHGRGGTVEVSGYPTNFASHIWILDIGYSRFNRNGFDLANWLHDDLQPADKRTEDSKGVWFAKQQGTGPRWLANAAEKHGDLWSNLLHSKYKGRLRKNIGRIK